MNKFEHFKNNVFPFRQSKTNKAEQLRREAGAGDMHAAVC